MANPFSWAFKSNAEMGNSEIKEIFPFSVKNDIFIRADILHTYEKILTDVAQRTSGLDKTQEPLLWDSAVATEAAEGLITLLACAMTDQTELFIVLKSGVLRKADATEEAKIKADYKKTGESKVGTFISFKNYRRTEMLRIYSGFEYCVLGSLNKTLNVANSVQLKISDLRQSVSLNDAGIAREQAKSIAEAMRNGNDVMLDAKDEVATASPDTAPAEKSIAFLANKKSWILNLPLSYVVGEQTPGIGSTGEADMRAVERGLMQYFVSIIRPVFQAVFGKEVTFKTQDFRNVATALEVLKTFDLASDENLSQETKRDIIARVFDVDPDEEAKRIEKETKAREAEAAKNPPVVAQANPAQPGQPNPAPAVGVPVRPSGATR